MAIPAWHTTGVNAIMDSLAKEYPRLKPGDRATVYITETISYSLFRSSDPADKDLHARIYCKGKRSSGPLYFIGMYRNEDKQ